MKLYGPALLSKTCAAKGRNLYQVIQTDKVGLVVSLADDFLPRIAAQRFGSFVSVQEAAFKVHEEDCDGKLFNEELGSLLDLVHVRLVLVSVVELQESQVDELELAHQVVTDGQSMIGVLSLVGHHAILPSRSNILSEQEVQAL